jgi:phage portal protein BeeE
MEDKVTPLTIPRVSVASRLRNVILSIKGVIPNLGLTSWSSSFPFRFSGWGWNADRTTSDYRKDLGPLDGNSLVMCVVNYTGTRLPEARPVVKRKRGDEWDTEDDHPVAQLIRRPNKHHVWADYAQVASLNWWVQGNVYFQQLRADKGGLPVELWYLPQTGEGGYEVFPRWPNDRRTPDVQQWANDHGEKEPLDWFISHYEQRVPGQPPLLIPAANVLHLKRGVNPGNTREGMGAFDSLVTELYGDNKMGAFTAAIMSNMGIQVPVLSPKDGTTKVTAMAAHAIKEAWIAKTTGKRAGEPVILDLPITAEKFGFSPTELDLSALRLIPESRVAAVTGIPAATLQLLVGLQNGTSYASSEQARQQGYEEVIIPIQTSWAEKLNWQLLTQFESDLGTVRLEFDTSNVRVLQEDRDALYRRTSEALRAGAVSLNEARASLGKPALGKDGDVYYLPAMVAPATLERIVQMAQVREEQAEPDPLDAEFISEVDKAQLAKLADMDQWFVRLEEQMKGFVRR